ncbi:MAG: hypothetical protein M1824_004400 [Vezdaea acicularis]|nr:MAG: hypothetical protein M1824_004400 [Vezdaea acicularis]
MSGSELLKYSNCGQYCIGYAYGEGGGFNCQLNDVTCFCSSNTYLNYWATCMKTATFYPAYNCPTSALDNDFTTFTNDCKGVGVSISLGSPPSGSGGGASVSGTASLAPTQSAAISSAIASVSSAGGTVTVGAVGATSTSSSSSGSGGLSGGAKAGIAIGVVLGVLLLLGAIIAFVIFRRRSKKKQAAMPPAGMVQQQPGAGYQQQPMQQPMAQQPYGQSQQYGQQPYGQAPVDQKGAVAGYAPVSGYDQNAPAYQQPQHTGVSSASGGGVAPGYTPISSERSGPDLGPTPGTHGNTTGTSNELASPEQAPRYEMGTH